MQQDDNTIKIVNSKPSADDSQPLNDLLPCPFCGGEAYRRVSNKILTVGCNDCLVSFANHVRFGCRADGEWNTRAR